MQLGLEDYDPLERCLDNFHKNEPCFLSGFRYGKVFGRPIICINIPNVPSASIFQPAPCQRVSSHRKVWAENTSQNGWCNKVCNRVWQIFRVRPAFLPGKADPRNPETGRTSLPRSRAPQGRAGLADAPLSPRPHFRFCRPRVRYASGWIRRPEGLRLSPSLFSLVFRQHSRNMQVAEAFCLPGLKTERCGSEGRCVRMSDRPGMPVPVRPVGQPACTRAAASSEASYSVRTDTAIICFVMWRAYPPRSCDLS